MRTVNKADQVREKVRERILSGEFGRRGRLPSLRMLAGEYNISQETINKVIQVLQAEGWILSLGQRGIFVNMPRVRMPGLLKNPSDYVKELGVEPVEEYLEPVQVVRPPVEMVEAMKLGEKGLAVRRLRKFGIPNVIFRMSETFFPKPLVTDTMLKKMEDPHYDVLGDIKKESGKFIQYVHEDVLARFPTEYEENTLKIVRTNPV